MTAPNGPVSHRAFALPPGVRPNTHEENGESMPHHQAATFRQRAAHLRTLATEMTNTPSMSLHQHAGVDTWYGPRADACAAELARAQHAVREAADELRTRAFVFDRRAEELEAATTHLEYEAALQRVT